MSPSVVPPLSTTEAMLNRLGFPFLFHSGFQTPMQPPTTSRFPGVSPSGQHTAEGGMMGPVPTPDAAAIPPVGHPSSYDGGFGIKPAPGAAGVLRTLPLPMPPQQSFAPQQPPISSPVPMPQHQQPQSNPVMSMRNMEGELNFLCSLLNSAPISFVYSILYSVFRCECLR